MNDAPHQALLPAGLYDLLPPEAEVEAAVTGRLIGVLASYGYERVQPPLVEFEETLLSGAGSTMASDTFRTMDPISHRMVALRADMTPQIARIAATRLPHRPRPLLLSYAGQVLRVRATQMRPERQFGQVGAELIGAAGPAADVEAIAVGGEAPPTVGGAPLSRRSGGPGGPWPRSVWRIWRWISPCRPWCRRLPTPTASPASGPRRC